jgi:ribosome biogenesis GTPase
MNGLVLSGSNNLFRVLCEDGNSRICPIKGKRFRDQQGVYNALAAGDRVEVEAVAVDRGLITGLAPRKNLFGRYNEKGRAQQAIAANIDLVVCVASPILPPFRPRFIDRVAVLAEAAHVPFLVVLNKIDLGEDDEVAERMRLYASLGYAILRCSVRTGQGIEELAHALYEKTTVFTGQSGVGKSSILNALDPKLTRKVGDISEKYARGRHTTTMAELICMNDGITKIIDTPGVRRLALRGIESSSLDAYFPEMKNLSPLCVFGLSCTHQHEEGCMILKALDEGRIHKDRYESYMRIRDELKSNEEYSSREGWSAAAKRKGGALRGDGVRKSARALGMDDDEGE